MTHLIKRRAGWIASAIVITVGLLATAAVAAPRHAAAGGAGGPATASAAAPSSRAGRFYNRLRHRHPRPPVTTTTTAVPLPTTASTAAPSSGPTDTTTDTTAGSGDGSATVPAGDTTTTPAPPATSGTTTTTTGATTTSRATTTTAAPTVTTVTTPAAGAPTHFATLPPGAALPSGAQCAAWVNALPAPAEVKGINARYNATRGQAVAGATGRSTRVDGNYTGTTEQILRWAACKWGIDEDMVKSQAVIESWWRMDTMGDRGTDPARCAPGHGIGADGFAGQCPESWGLLQIRYPYNQVAFPWAITSSAFNADWAYAQWRSCFEGDYGWLNTVERGQDYAAGDAWGCFGTWFSGRWYTQGAKDYVARVQGTLADRTWTTANFKQP